MSALTASEPLLLRPAEAARWLQVSRTKVYDLINRGELPALRLGRRCTRIPREALTDWVAREAGRPAGGGLHEAA